MEPSEILSLLIELKQALARERGGGTPLDRTEYLALDRRVAKVIEDLKSQGLNPNEH